MNKGLMAILGHGYGMQCPMMVPGGGVPSAPQLPPRPRPHRMGMPPPPFAQLTTPALSQVDHGSTPSPGRAVTDSEDLFGEEVRIAMGKLRI